ncbi:ATP-binding protein [Tateyamaria sp.]|uniref:ATP-binding protein n=1 Tax=Tateyamaria sp. TaxID=1929288 RepID=UPI003B2128D2
MSFALLKHYLPRGIYGRAALILLLPVVVVQLVVSVVFIQRHFEDVTHQMADAVVRELRMVLGAQEAVLPEIAGLLQIDVRPVEPEALEAPDTRLWYDFSGLVVKTRLRAALPEIAVVDLYDNDIVRLVIDSDRGPLEVVFDRRRISAANPHQLLVNMVFFSVQITIIAFIYLRNQLRPIKRLARAAEAFGRGRHMAYTPGGATEVRAAGTAFVDMRNRIERQIETRTLMLSGVSHDLRTPLTRMRLALSMLEDDDRVPLEQDVTEMQRMIDAFLSFAAGDTESEPESVDPVEMAKSIVEDAQRAGQAVTIHSIEGSGMAMLRPVAMRRALDNLVSNAVRYGARAEVSVAITDKSLRLRVEDDGPGIPEDQRADAQRPFVRLDPARNQDKGSGVGLGLAIATDIARAHGGVLRLGRSDRLGGLRADIVIAR